MIRKNVLMLFALLLVAGTVAAVAPVAHAGDAGNPCGGKAMNPCGGKHAENPCGMKAAGSMGVPAVNPCFAKMGTVFTIADPMGRNTVTFRSEAPLEDIVGTTNEIRGYIVFDPRNPMGGARGEIVVPVASLHTGIPMRDEHLRGPEWLDAAEHEQITFRIQKTSHVRRVKKGDGFVTYELTAEGPFTLRGGSQDLKTRVPLTYLEESEMTRGKMEGDLLAARTSFTVALEDFGIKGFEGAVGAKVGKTIDIDVSLMASDAMVAAAAGAGNPCGGKAMNPCGGKAMNPCGGKAGNPCGGKASKSG